MPKRTNPYWEQEFKTNIGKLRITLAPDLAVIATRFSEHTRGHVSVERAMEFVEKDPVYHCDVAVREFLQEYLAGDYTRILHRQVGTYHPPKTEKKGLEDCQQRRADLLAKMRIKGLEILARPGRASISIRAVSDALGYAS